MDHHRSDQQPADPAVQTPARGPVRPGRSRPASSGWISSSASATTPAKPGGDVDRLAPGQQRACRRSGERHATATARAAQISVPIAAGPALEAQTAQAGCSTKCASRLVSLALDMTGRRNTVSKSPLS
jgi:hypothetical protein